MNFDHNRTFLKEKIGRGVSASAFDDLALEVFHFQYKYNAFYREYCSLIGKDSANISKISDIPFLPIPFFKNNILKTGDWHTQTIFSSSGTTGAVTSAHHVRDIEFYKQIARQGFEQHYGSISDYCILGLLPSYLERKGSSLVAMVDDFIDLSNYNQSGFFLNNLDKLFETLSYNKQHLIPTLLIGVSFALLDFVEQYQLDFPDLIIMETGGMKGRRREMIREELHNDIKQGFNTQHIHSEYGMTELFSQGYSKKEGIFHPIASLKILGREINDPLSISVPNGRLSALNIIDLGNLDTCSFIATDDLGRVYSDGNFMVLGRLDNSDIRGCNLLIIN